MGRDLKFCVMTESQYQDKLQENGSDFFMALEDYWSHYDKYRNLNFEYEGVLTRDELKEKAHDAVDDDDFRTLEACATILAYMNNDDDVCIYENS